MGKLWDLVEDWRTGMQYPPSDRQIAIDIGVAPTTFSGWRDGLTELPKRHNLWELHRVTNIPFEAIMQAAIDDARLFDPEQAKLASMRRKGTPASRDQAEQEWDDATGANPEGPEFGA